MVSPETQQALNAVIQNYGRNALNDSTSVEAALRESAGGATREVDLLLTALKTGIPQDLVAGATDGAALVKKLSDESFLSGEAARAAVEAWAAALNLPVSFPAIASQPAPTAPPVTAVPAPPVQEPAPSVQPPAPEPREVIGYGAPTTSANPGMMLTLVAAAVVVILGGGGFALYKRAHSTGSDTGSTTSSTTTAGSTGSDSTGTTGFTSTGSTTDFTSSGTTSGSIALDLDSYNNRLASVEISLTTADQTFSTENDKLGLITDDSVAYDTAASIYDKYASDIDQSASDFRSVTPPSDLATFHSTFMSIIDRKVQIVKDIASSARSHNMQDFLANTQKGKDFIASSNDELWGVVDSSGYDLDTFKSSSRLVRK